MSLWLSSCLCCGLFSLTLLNSLHFLASSTNTFANAIKINIASTGWAFITRTADQLRNILHGAVYRVPCTVYTYTSHDDTYLFGSTLQKYMRPLKLAEVIDSSVVDEIFFQIPDILKSHEYFLALLSERLKDWHSSQNIGDLFIDCFTNQPMSEIYTAFINNWTHAKESIRVASNSKGSFRNFLDTASREHKGKLTLDALMIMPVQRIPRYELLIKELLKHTDTKHSDYQLLVAAQNQIHDLALKIDAVDEESKQMEKSLSKMREIESLIDGSREIELATPDRCFIRYDFVTIPGGLGTKKERCLFLFSDLLLITSIKRKSGVSRKASAVASL